MSTVSFNPLAMPLSGVHSISASAGTGKTYAITTLYLRYLLDPSANCSVDSILVTTFTEAATAELKDRLRRRLKEAFRLLEHCEQAVDAEALVESGQADAVLVELLTAVGGWESPHSSRVRERIEDALLSFDQAPVFTIHGFCHRILNELVFETGSRFDAELVTSLQPLVDEAVSDFAARWWAAADAPLAGWLKLDAALWGAMHRVADQALGSPDATIVPDGDELESLLQSRLPQEFDDQVSALAEVWKHSGTEAIALIQTAVINKVLNRGKYGQPRQIERAGEFLETLIRYRDPNLFQLDDGSRQAPTQLRLSQSAIIGGTRSGQIAPQHELFARYKTVVTSALRLSGHAEQIRAAMLSRLARAVREHVAARKQESGVMSFADLLHLVDRALSGDRNEFLLEALRDRYRVAMVDEFQDTDPVQYRIFRQIFMDGVHSGDDRACVMIGDPKQSIYRFRGADIHACLEALRATPQQNRHQMGMNWRSDRSLVDAVQAVFASAPDPFLNGAIDLPPIEARFGDRLSDGAALSVTLLDNPFATEKRPEASKDEALRRVLPRVADDIVTQLNSELQILDAHDADSGRPVEPQDIAILCRAGRELRTVQQLLADRGVPAVLQTEESVFDAPEATSLLLVLRGILEAGSQSRLATALQTSLFGFDAARLDSLRHDEQQLSEWIGHMHRWRECWSRDGFVVMWTRLLKDQATVSRLAGQMTGERQITNYLHLGELLHAQAEVAGNGPDELLHWLERMVAEPERRAADQSQLRLETDAAAVQLCTIHKSKGLEYSIVYCPTLWSVRSEKLAPDTVLSRLDAVGQPLETHEFDVGSDLIEARQQRDQDEQRAEDRRLLYVALTRAKHQCHIYWASVDGAAGSALGQFMLQGTAKLDDAAQQSRIGHWLRGLGVARVELRRVGGLAQNVNPPRFVPRVRQQQSLTCRTVTRPMIRSLVQTSFTALSRTGAAHSPDEVADRDAVAAQQVVAVDVESEGSAESRVPLAGLTGGRQLGDVVHQVYEDVLGPGKLVGADESTVHAAVLAHLQPGMRRHQIDDEWADPLATSITISLLRPLLETSAGTAPFCKLLDCKLLDIARPQLTCEMPFLMRLGLTDEPADADAFAEAFEQSSVQWIQNYAVRVRSMSASGLRGFLAGFIDLVFEHDGRWYVLDYKTNNLGPTSGDYSSERLREAMVDHDYVLQYHLYCVALDAFLRRRVPKYDYGTHFGGVVYLFVRAIQPDAPGLNGVFFDRPDDAVISSLSEAIMGELQAVK